MNQMLYKITDTPEWNIILNLLLDPTVSEVQANNPEGFFIKKSGKRIHLEDLKLDSEERYFHGIEKGLVPFVKSMNVWNPNSFVFEGRLNYEANGIAVAGRCHIVLPPAADYPQVTIAKKTAMLKDLDSIASAGSMSTEMMNFMNMAIKANLTVVFSGGTGAGKTTMLEALAKNIPDSVRIGVAEDTPELVLNQPNVSYLKSVPKQPGMDEKDVATLSWVVAQFQRMRTDKVIIGETRGKEFADFLIAANSGMDGSMTTLHAENPTRCLTKMTSFVMKMGDGQPTRAINNDIANAIDLIVQLIITPEGKHRISHIEEIVPVLGNTEEAKITSQTLYAWDSVKDAFYKVGSMSDSLRDKCILNGQDVEAFIKSEREKRYPIHNGVLKSSQDIAGSRNAGGGGGLLRRQGRMPTSPPQGPRQI